ncbi:tyrosine-type recombinase/integrase [Acrocarpospora catenulata]|uniref:tyrosine-type recombinase/integrase n=1 Tax=Acrocarpospora catenulata TaxID=2836182 RepID=UPI0027DF8BA7|nr:hypothetical protein [Acrocarpospora catenulata]
MPESAHFPLMVLAAVLIAAAGLPTWRRLHYRSYWPAVGYPLAALSVWASWRRVALGCGLTKKRQRYWFTLVPGSVASTGLVKVKRRFQRVAVDTRPFMWLPMPTRHGWRVTVHTLEGQTPADYSEAAERLAHSWGVHAVRASSPRPGRVVLAATVRDPLVQIDQLPPSTELLGVTVGRLESGTPWVIDFKIVPQLDGEAAAATTIARKRSVFYNVLQYAVDLEELPSNPIDKVKAWKPPKVREVVDRRVVVNPSQARELLNAVTYVGRLDRGRHLRAFFTCLYFAALRPAEALGLREADCYLPATGWGLLVLAKSKPQANKRWTNSGDAHDDRGLKHRASEEGRPVPIPPELVTILRAHIEEFGVNPDGRLFRTSRGGVISIGTYCNVWRKARHTAFRPEQVASPLAGRPYDLRHAAVSLWLNAGVAAPEVADRAGHGVDVLLKVYAKCIDGGAEIANQRISDALGP